MGAAGGRHPGGREEGSEGKGWEKRISETSKDDTARRQEKPKTKAEKNYYRSEAAGPIQKLSKNTTPTTQDGHKTKDQEMVKVLCTGLVPAQKPSARASLSFSLSLSLSLSLLSLLFSPSPNHTTQDKQANKQTNNVTLVSRVCTVAPVRVLLRARSDEYPCPRPRRVESRVGQGGREGGRE